MIVRILTAAALCILSTCAASAAEVDDYIYWKTVGLIDANCHYLKAIERRIVDKVTVEMLQTVPQTQHFYSDRTSEDEYSDWLTRTDQSAVAEAARVGCTNEAEPFLLRGRGVASELIYQDLVLAFHFNGLPKEDPLYQALAEDQIKAATGYDQFLQQVYGANFQAFAAAQRDLAAQRLPSPGDGSFAGFYDPLGLGLSDPGPDFASIWLLQSAVRATVRDIQFEVYAEVAGYRVWPENIGPHQVFALHPTGSTELSAHIVSGPHSFDVVGGGKISAVLVRMLSGRLWLMSYGEVDAQAVALLIRTAPLPEGQSRNEAWSSKQWRSMTTRYDLTPVESSCLGGPCWEVPQAARDRLLEISAFEEVELWFAADPASSPETESNEYSRGRLPHADLHIVEGLPLT